jgi:hypothetical protein
VDGCLSVRRCGGTVRFMAREIKLGDPVRAIVKVASW